MFQQVISYLTQPFIKGVHYITKRDLKLLALLLIPVIYLINTIIIHLLYGDFYIGSVDPEYFHLYNGIAIAGGNLSVEYIAHPGTPLEYLMAFAARITHLFQANDYFVQDFVDNPEKYIHAANVLQNTLIAITLFYGATTLLKQSGSLFIALLFQSIPFGNYTLLEISGRVIPESIMVWPLLLIVWLVLKYIYTPDDKINVNKTFFIFAIVAGLGFACKISFIPVMALPLILIKSTLKQKLRYIYVTGIFTAIFAYPIVFNFSKFKEWTTGVVTQSGLHGTAEAGFLNFDTLIPDFKYLFSQDKLLFILLLATVPILLFELFRKKSDTKITRALLAVDITIVLSVLFTLKRFSFHYFMPFYVLKFGLILLLASYFTNEAFTRQVQKLKYLVFIVVSVAIITIVYKEKQKFARTIAHIERRAEVRKEKRDRIQSFVNKNSSVIVTAPYYGAPFQSHAQSSGFMMTYKLKGYFKDELMEKYPHQYIYVGWSDKFYFWDNFINIDTILENSDNEFYVFIGEWKEDAEPVIEERLFKVIDKEAVKKELLFHDPLTNEKFIRYSLKSGKRFSVELENKHISAIVDNIKEDPAWLNNVNIKAQEKGISLDSMLYLDARWILNNNFQ